MESTKILGFSARFFSKWAGVAVVTILSGFLTPRAEASQLSATARGFNPSQSQEDQITVRSSTVLAPGRYSLGLSIDHSTNALPYFNTENEPNNDSARTVKSRLTMGDVGVAIGVLNNLEIGLNLPHIISQEISDDNYRGEYKNAGITEVVVSAKMRILTLGSGGIAAAFHAAKNQTEGNPYTGETDRPVYSFELIADQRIARFQIAGNLGYKWQPKGQPVRDEDNESPLAPMQDQALGSIGLSYDHTVRTTSVLEFYGARANTDPSAKTPRGPTSSEILLGVKQAFATDVVGQAGLTTEVDHSYGSSDLRVFLGINMAFGGQSVGPGRATEVSAKNPQPAPVQKPAAAAKPDDQLTLENITFRFNSHKISKQGESILSEQMGKKIKAKIGRIARIVIEGHTCSIGTPAYNKKLSLKRAEEIKKWLITNYRVAPRTLETVGYGERIPLASNSTEDGRKKNRRVEIKIYYKSAYQNSVAVK